MKVRATHSTWADGAEEFAEWLKTVPGVKTVVQGNLRSSHVKSGQRQPKVTPTLTSVKVAYFGGGKVQMLFVSPVERVSMKGLARRIRRSLKERKQRGGVGVSSNADVPIPLNVKRRMELDAASKKAEPVATAVVLPEAQPAVQPASSVEPVELTEEENRGYEHLLSLAPNATEERFEVAGVSRALTEEFGPKLGLHLYGRFMRVLGLVRMTGKASGRMKVFEVARRPVCIVEKPARAHAPRLQAAPAQPQRKGRGRRTLNDLRSLHKQMLATIDDLRRQGFTVEYTLKIKAELDL